MIERVVSGGQTGADRAALDVAAESGLETGGWVPRGRRAEDGVVPDRYAGMIETPGDDYGERTRLNVRDSDATLVFCFGEPAGGTALTIECADRIGRPSLVLDLDACQGDAAVELLHDWLATVAPRVLNVAGPRRSQAPRIDAAVGEILRKVLAR